MGKRLPAPWRRLEKGQEVDYRVLRIRQDVVADPRDGAAQPRVVIESPDWVNVIPVTPEGKVVLIHQFRFGVWADTLEIPGGLIEPGEAPRAAARRELEEETGYVPARIEALGFVHPNPAVQTNRAFSFLALGCRKVHAGRQDESEDITVELRPLAQIPKLIARGMITHACVVAAFQLEAARAKSVRPRTRG